MSENRFIQLVQDNDGFEFYQAFQNDVDHVLAAKVILTGILSSKKGKLLSRI